MADRVCIIGAGLAGLSAAYDLGRLGHRVTLTDSSPDLGGLASSLIMDGRPIERFYHFICGGDNDLIDLVDEIGLSDRLHWVQSKTSFYYRGKLFDFGLPTDLLRFTPVPFFQRIRFGLNVMSSRYRNSWQELDGIPAKKWLIEQIGPEAYEVIWDPLLRVKFGDHHDKVSAAWIWHRIYRVASSRRRLWEREYLGYLERGSDTVVDELAAHIRQMPNVEIRTSTRVQQILTENGAVTGIRIEGSGEIILCQNVISTVALTLLTRMAPDLPLEYVQKIGSVDYIGVVCGLLKLKQPITSSFWVNINDPNIPFNGFIEYSNLNKHMGLGDKSIVYIPYYLRTTEPRFSFPDEQIMDEFVDGLRRVNPAFSRDWIEEAHISRAPYAQAICGVNFSQIVPDHQTPLTGLYITDSTQFYPEDRTISAAIRLGRRVASMIAAKPAVSIPAAVPQEEVVV
jgi:protoporphyrinogen oxidase